MQLEVFYSKNIASYASAAYMIRLKFVYILYSLCIVFMYIKKTYKGCFSQLANCIATQVLQSQQLPVQIIICSYVYPQKNIQMSFQLASCGYRFCIVCTLFVCTKNIHFKFQAVFNLNVVQVLCSLYIFCIHVGI